MKDLNGGFILTTNKNDLISCGFNSTINFHQTFEHQIQSVHIISPLYVMVTFFRNNVVIFVHIYTGELKFGQNFNEIIIYTSTNITSNNYSDQSNFVISLDLLASSTERKLIGIIIESMEFLLFEISNDLQMKELGKIPNPGINELTSFRFIGNNGNEFLNDYAIMCFKEENAIAILDLNDLTTINVTRFKRKVRSNFKVIDEMKHVCLMWDTSNHSLYLVNANESFIDYLKTMIVIDGEFTSGKIMKTFYEIESNIWKCRICTMSDSGIVCIYDTFSNNNKYSVLKISQFNAHNGLITFAFIKG